MKPIKKLETKFRVFGLIDIKDVVIILLKMLPIFYSFKLITNIPTLVIVTIVDYIIIYFLFSKSISGIETNIKSTKRILTDKAIINVTISSITDNNSIIKVNNEYVIAYIRKGKAFSNMSYDNLINSFEQELKTLINNKLRFKTISCLNQESSLELEQDNILAKERTISRSLNTSTDYILFYSKDKKTILEYANSFNNRELKLIDQNSLKILLNEVNDNLIKFDLYTLDNLPYEMNYYFMNYLKLEVQALNVDYYMCTNNTPISNEFVKQKLNFSIREENTTRTNTVTDALESNESMSMYENILIDSFNNKEKLYEFSSYFLIDKKVSKSRINEFIRNIQKKGYIVKNTNNIAPQIYSNRFCVQHIKPFVIQSSILATGFVNDQQELDDRYGKLLSVTNRGKVIFNPFIITDNRKSYSMQILGDTWSGKSTLLKLFVLLNYYNNNKTIIMDIENEYSILVQNLGGTNIDPNKEFVNIMEIYIDEYITEDENLLFKLNLNENIERILTFYKYLIEDNGVLKELKTLLFSYYTTMYQNENNDIYCSKKYTISHFYNYLLLIYKDLKKSSLLEEIKYERTTKLILEIESFLSDNNEDFNTMTNINLDSDLIAINLQTLMNEENSALKKAYIEQLFQVVIWNSMKKNRDYNEHKGISRNNFMDRYDETRFLAIVIDEEHQFLNSENESLLKSINSLTRRAPKYFTGIWGASHSVDDYNLTDGTKIANLKKTLFQLRTYKIIMKQSASTLSTYKELLNENENSNLTLDAIKKCFSFETGDYLLAFGDSIYNGNVIVDDSLHELVFRVKK